MFDPRSMGRCERAGINPVLSASVSVHLAVEGQALTSFIRRPCWIFRSIYDEA